MNHQAAFEASEFFSKLLVVALMGRSGPISNDKIAEIAAIQDAIVAMEAVIVDLDANALPVFRGSNVRLIYSA